MKRNVEYAGKKIPQEFETRLPAVNASTTSNEIPVRFHGRETLVCNYQIA
jgi:hypothetical protein